MISKRQCVKCKNEFASKFASTEMHSLFEWDIFDDQICKQGMIYCRELLDTINMNETCPLKDKSHKRKFIVRRAKKIKRKAKTK